MVLSRRARWALFAAAVLIFIGTAFFVVRYAQGYAFDIGEWRFVRTGAVRLESNVSATVTLDGEQIGSIAFIGNTYAADGLVPGTYALRAEREGYSSWSKTVVVQEGFVTDFTSVLLLDLSLQAASESRSLIRERYGVVSATPVPTPAASPTPTVSGTPVPERGITFADGTLSRDGEVIATGVLGHEVTDNRGVVLWWTRNEVWVMWLRDSGELGRLDGDREILTRLSSVISFATWWPDDTHVAAVTGTEYRIIETDTRGGTNIIKLP